jgi:hypothetical protein
LLICLLFFLAGMLGGGAIAAPLTALVGSWFTRDVGLAIDIVAVALAIEQGGFCYDLAGAYTWTYG